MRPNRFAAVVLLLLFPSTTLAQAPAPRRESNAATDVAPLDLSLRAVTSPTPRVDVNAAKLRAFAASLRDFPQAQQVTCADSEARGRTDAGQNHRSWGWFAGGIGAGVVLGFLGTGGITAGSAFYRPQPKAVPAGVDASCYSEGYGSRARRKNVLWSLGGGLIGTAVWFVIYAAANSFD